MKSGKNLIILFVLILFLSIYLFVLSYQHEKHAVRLNDRVRHTHLVIEGITNLNTLITEFEALDRSYIVTNKKDFIQELSSREIKASFAFNRIKSLTADNETQQKNLLLLGQAIKLKLKYQDSIFDVLKRSQKEAMLLLYHREVTKLYPEIKSILESMLRAENALLNQQSERYEKALPDKFIYSVSFELLGLILLAIAFWKINKEINNRKSAEDEAHRSEAKYKGLIEKSSLIIFTTDLYGRFTYMSDKGYELTGYERKELIGKPFTILIPANETKEIFAYYLNQYRNFIKDLEEEFEIKTKNNTIKIIKLSTVLIEENGKITGFQSIAKDITEVKYVESLIRESKIKLQQQQEEYNFRMQAVLNNIPMVLYIKDLEGRYMMVNKNFTERFKISADDIIGRKNKEMDLFKERAEFYDNIDTRVKNTGKPIEFEEVMSTEEGKRNFLVTEFPLFDINNNIFAISSVAKDITDITYHMQQLIDARLKAEKAEQLQEAFLANMSHEIRTPMNGIMGMTNILLDTNLDAEQKEYAQLIKKSSDALLMLINDVLDLSKIKAGRMELELIDFNIKEAVQNVLQPIKVNLKKNVALNYEISSTVPDFVKGDSHKLFQILNNLVSNAVKFTEKGEIKVDVNVIENDEEKIFISFVVSDTGIGISEEYIKNIFESFTQGSNDTARRFGGTGLGLAITKRLIQLQNGSIHVQSTPGAGSVFQVKIPYLPSSTKHTGSINNKNTETNFDRDGFENKTVLVVEDNLVNQRVLTSVLQKMKLRWDIANNGKEAVEILEGGNSFDLIIMDLQMPVMDGFEATDYVRKKLKIYTPIIAMTASTLRNEKIKCMDAGMNEYISKPFSPNELIKHVHNLINRVDTKANQMKQEQMLTEKLYDLAYLHDLDDNDYLIEMIELFFETTSEILEEMQANIKKENWDAVGKLSHKLKSSLGPLQISKMLAIASAIEENAKNTINANEIIDLNKKLRSEYAIVKPAIEAELSKAKKISNGFVIS